MERLRLIISELLDNMPKPDRNRDRQDSYEYGYEDGKRDTLKMVLALQERSIK